MKVNAQNPHFDRNCTIPAVLFGGAALMGNQSSNKTADCRSAQTLAVVSSTQTYDHVYQAPVMDPALHLTPGR